MKSPIAIAFIIITFILIIHGCTKETIVVDSDNELYKEITESGFTFYQSGVLLSGASPNPHGSFKLRFNAIAFAALDNSEELPTGSSFPDGSVIVKDIYNGSSIDLYAVMKKDASNTKAGSDWLWAEFGTDGSMVYSIDKKGSGCTGCHGGSPSRDFTRTFDLH